MNCDFTKEELSLLTHGFGFFVQDFNHPDGDPVYELLDKLFCFSETAENDDHSMAHDAE